MIQKKHLPIDYEEQLIPILDLLGHKWQTLDPGDWYALLKRTEQSVLNHPEQYIAKFTADDRQEMLEIIPGIFAELADRKSKKY